MNYIMTHVLEITILCYLLLFCSGMVAWVLNGIGIAKFDLGFVWQGVSTLFGPGVFGSIKYIADSGLNSDKGVSPYEQLIKTGDRKTGDKTGDKKELIK